jgi:hypothetical protein
MMIDTRKKNDIGRAKEARGFSIGLSLLSDLSPSLHDD